MPPAARASACLPARRSPGAVGILNAMVAAQPAEKAKQGAPLWLHPWLAAEAAAPRLQPGALHCQLITRRAACGSACQMECLRMTWTWQTLCVPDRPLSRALSKANCVSPHHPGQAQAYLELWWVEVSGESRVS